MSFYWRVAVGEDVDCAEWTNEQLALILNNSNLVSVRRFEFLHIDTRLPFPPFSLISVFGQSESTEH